MVSQAPNRRSIQSPVVEEVDRLIPLDSLSVAVAESKVLVVVVVVNDGVQLPKSTS